MFRFITKADYFKWIDDYSERRDPYRSASQYNLKDIQDHFAITLLDQGVGLKVAEVGGADCRVLRGFAERHECWNIEKFEGKGVGPKKVIETEGVRNVQAYLGEFSPELPDNYFDLVFSVSVVEHIETEGLQQFFRDMARILKPGGRAAHAIDIYLFDEADLDSSPAQYTTKRLNEYMNATKATDGALSLEAPAEADLRPVFSCKYASNADREMHLWNRVVPELAQMRLKTQSVSLAASWIKT